MQICHLSVFQIILIYDQSEGTGRFHRTTVISWHGFMSKDWFPILVPNLMHSQVTFSRDFCSVHDMTIKFLILQ